MSSKRQAELLWLLAQHPEGMSRRELAKAMYGDYCGEDTVAAVISRTRQRLGPGAIKTEMVYKLGGVIEAVRVERKHRWSLPRLS